MEQILPPLRRGAPGAELPGDLLQGGGHVPGVQIRRDLPDQHGSAAKILAGKTELLQQGQVLQQQRPVLPAQLHGGGGQQGLAHGGLQGGFQPVEVHPLVGGVLVDEPHAAVSALADDVGPQQLSGDAPGGLSGGLQGLLSRHLRLGNGGDEGPRFR